MANRLCFLPLLLLVACSLSTRVATASLPTTTEPDRLTRLAIEEALGPIPVQRVSFDKAELCAVVEFLNREVKNWRVKNLTYSPPRLAPFCLSPLLTHEYGTPVWKCQVSLSLENTTLLEVLTRVCHDYGLTYARVLHYGNGEDQIEIESVKVNEAVERTQAKLEQIVIDKLNFEKLDIKDVVTFLNQKCRQLYPQNSGVEIKLELPLKDTKPPTYRRKVSITLQDVPLSDVLGYVVNQTNLEYHVEPGKVVITVQTQPITDQN